MYKSAIAGVLTLAIAPGLFNVACNRSNPSTEAPAAQTEPAAAPAKAPVIDSWITTKIQAQYFADAAVKGRNIDVTTNNGAVMLMGRVDSEQARQRAVDIAKQTDGVSRVDDHLVVGAKSSQAPQSVSGEVSKVGNRIASGWITTKIQAQYFADPTVKGHEIDVDTVNGVVALSGTVDSEAARERAVALAKQTEGVKDVEDHLMVQAATAERRPAGGLVSTLTDAEITSRIQSKYFVDDDVRARNINVDTSKGVVTLSGTVDSERVHREAVRLARRTPGVNDVRDQLKVEKAVATSGRRDTGLAEKIEDAWITTKIQSRYWIDERVKARNINVTTNNGVVTLAGEITPEAHQQALDLARDTDGVTRVVDRLKMTSDGKSETKTTTPNRSRY
jgi:hyperosmotically inducible protein